MVNITRIDELPYRSDEVLGIHERLPVAAM
jgi:hypothetical protein